MQEEIVRRRHDLHNKDVDHHHHIPPWVKSFDLFRHRRTARLRETNWSSKNGGFADGLVTLPRKAKYS